MWPGAKRAPCPLLSSPSLTQRKPRASVSLQGVLPRTRWPPSLPDASSRPWASPQTPLSRELALWLQRAALGLTNTPAPSLHRSAPLPAGPHRLVSLPVLALAWNLVKLLSASRASTPRRGKRYNFLFDAKFCATHYTAVTGPNEIIRGPPTTGAERRGALCHILGVVISVVFSLCQ